MLFQKLQKEKKSEYNKVLTKKVNNFQQKEKA